MKFDYSDMPYVSGTIHVLGQLIKISFTELEICLPPKHQKCVNAWIRGVLWFKQQSFSSF